ncbi:MAG TPA: ABC transporter permease, partial [Thermoanaerobaculia bacterium]
MFEIFRYRDLIATLVSRELKVRYRRSAIGFTWTMLQPLLMMLVLQIVFSSIFRFKLDFGNYPVFVMAGLLFWNFFSQSIVASMNSLKGNAQLLRKLPIPREVFPLATVISGVVNLCFALVPLLLILLVTHHPITPALLFLPISILLAGLFTLGAGLLLSPLAV